MVLAGRWRRSWRFSDLIFAQKHSLYSSAKQLTLEPAAQGTGHRYIPHKTCVRIIVTALLPLIIISAKAVLSAEPPLDTGSWLLFARIMFSDSYNLILLHSCRTRSFFTSGGTSLLGIEYRTLGMSYNSGFLSRARQ